MLVDTYRPEDRSELDTLLRRVFGDSWAEASARRWDWQYRRNPHSREPRIWVARDGPRVVGQYATMPVKVSVRGRELDGSWGMDVAVAPERQRQGLGEVLFQTWDQHSGASLGLGLSAASYRLFQKLRWPDVGPLPCLVKPLTARAFARTSAPAIVNSAIALVAQPVVRLLRGRAPTDATIRHVEHFDSRFTDLWERVAPRFDLAVRRDANYLEWKFVELPHLRYSIVASDRGGSVDGYAVFRHDAGRRVTALVDFLVDPDDPSTFAALLHVAEAEARAAGSHKIRAFAMNAAFRRTMHANGYFRVRSTIQFVAKVNAVAVDRQFYRDTRRWHVTLGDSDQDR